MYLTLLESYPSFVEGEFHEKGFFPDIRSCGSARDYGTYGCENYVLNSKKRLEELVESLGKIGFH